MEEDEIIRSHVLSVWRESRKTFSIGGKEGMLILTDRHVSFVRKTKAKIKWWQAASKRQVMNLLRGHDIMGAQDGYGEKELLVDLENKKNVEISFNNILKINWEEKTWGSVLNLDYLDNDKTEKYRFTVAQDWVKYPIKNPTKFLKVNWTPFVESINNARSIKE
ncbi:MAG: hypothetical protein R1F52_03205 [Candidatus Nitrosoabyssus spongiisocia]|nr:MAG: hypothetical protein R1F52_03205 [Nitrosopumilaceae archaeon AB1(1)]